MPRSITITRCPHGIDAATCPACAQEQFDTHVAVQLASRDPQTVDDLRFEFEQWLSCPDAQRAIWGDNWPAIAPEVP